MSSQSDAIRRFTDAWKRGDDDAINNITLEVTENGTDAELATLVRHMADNPHGGQ